MLALIAGGGVVIGSVHPGVHELQGLYLGVGTALAGTGNIALGGQLTIAPWVTSLLPTSATRGFVIVGSLALAISGGTLLGSPLRYGLTATSVVVGWVDALVLVLAVVCACVRLQVPAVDSR